MEDDLDLLTLLRQRAEYCCSRYARTLRAMEDADKQEEFAIIWLEARIDLARELAKQPKGDSMPAMQRAQFEAVNSDKATLDSFAALNIDWTKLAALIQALLGFLGVTVPTGATVQQLHAAATSAGINWGTFLQTVLKWLPILLGLIGGGAAPTTPTP
jgi:hypothetical protein